MKQVTISEFKAKCLALLKHVQQAKKPLLITRFGKPMAAYHVSGEYAMIKAGVEKGIVEERAAVLEIMTALKRAGADVVITYWARELAAWTRE